MGKGTWQYNLINSEIWTSDSYDTRELAIKAALYEIDKYKMDISEFQVGQVEDVTNFGVDTNMVIEDIQNSMYEEAGEVSEDYLRDISNADFLELDLKLNKVFRTWQREHGYNPDFYKVVNITNIKVDEARKLIKK